MKSLTAALALSMLTRLNLLGCWIGDVCDLVMFDEVPIVVETNCVM